MQPFMVVPDVTFGQVFERLGAVLVVLMAYGWIAARIARALGDRGPMDDGRTSASPMAHLDLVGAVVAIFYRVAWSKPIDSDVLAFRSPRWGSVLIVAGSSAAAALLGVVCLGLRSIAVASLEGSAGIVVASFLVTTFEIAFATALLNLLPIPPLTGTHLVAAVRPEWHKRLQGARVRWFGTLVLVAAFVLGPLAPWLRATVGAVRAWF